MPSKMMSQEKRKKREERKRKVKVKNAVSLLIPKTISIFLLFAHARTSQANVFAMFLQLDQRVAKCTTCKRLCAKFQHFIALQRPENRPTSFKTRFSAKSPEGNELT